MILELIYPDHTANESTFQLIKKRLFNNFFIKAIILNTKKEFYSKNSGVFF
jgi:hypothetical protein